MNLEQAYRQLVDYRRYLKPEVETFPNKEQPFYYQFKYISLLRSELELVQRYAPFLIDPGTLEDLNEVISKSSSSIVTTDKSTGDRFIKAYTSIYNIVNNFLDYIGPDVISNSNEYELTVKLVDVNNLEDFEKLISQLKFAIGVPTYDLGGKFELEKVESGSILLKLLFDTIVGQKILKVIGGLLQMAIDLKTEYHKSQMAAEQLRSSVIKNDMLELIKKQIEDHHELDKLERAQRIINNNNLPTDRPDYLNTYKGVIETFGALLEKGTEFYPSINAPKDVIESFPDDREIKSLKEAQKLLEEAKKSNEPKEMDESTKADSTDESAD